MLKAGIHICGDHLKHSVTDLNFRKGIFVKSGVFFFLGNLFQNYFWYFEIHLVHFQNIPQRISSMYQSLNYKFYTKVELTPGV